MESPSLEVFSEQQNVALALFHGGVQSKVRLNGLGSFFNLNVSVILSLRSLPTQIIL